MFQLQLRRGALACAVVVMSAGSAFGDLSVGVRPSSAPNAFGSPSWSGYNANALNALENDLFIIGDRNTDPTGYEVITSGFYETGDIMVTSFNSWRGVADPSSPFDAELGNRLHFGLHIVGDGSTMFRLEDLEFSITSSDAVLDFVGNFNGFDYSSTRTGIWWGDDRTRGTSDDVRYSSGNGLTLVDEMVYVGVGNAYWPQPSQGQTNQEAIDDVIAYIVSNDVVITGGYSIVGTDGRAYAQYQTLHLIPAPGAVSGLMLLGLAGGMRRRRRL